MTIEKIKKRLKSAGLKLTPQRLIILQAVYDLGNHPTAEQIGDHIREAFPGIALGPIYNVLDTLVENRLIRRVKTDRDAMRYDGIMDRHHHLYCAETDRIEDYFDEELDEILNAHFRKKGISDFEIKDIILQIKGEEAGWEFLRNYAGQVNQFTKSGAAPAGFVGGGEAAVGIVFSHDIVKRIQDGMPLVLSFP